MKSPVFLSIGLPPLCSNEIFNKKRHSMRQVSQKPQCTRGGSSSRCERGLAMVWHRRGRALWEQTDGSWTEWAWWRSGRKWSIGISGRRWAADRSVGMYERVGSGGVVWIRSNLLHNHSRRRLQIAHFVRRHRNDALLLKKVRMCNDMNRTNIVL